VFQRSLKVLVALCLMATAVLGAQNPFIGEWKLDSSRSRMPDEMKVESKGGNTYAFDFGAGVETIVADGTPQPGLYESLLSAKIDAADTWIVARTSKKDGRLMLRATWKLSADGSTLTDYYREFQPDGSTISVSMDYVYRRTGTGGSGFAADWQSFKETINTPYTIEVKPFQGDGLAFVNRLQEITRNVKFDGKDYPHEGPHSAPGDTSSAQRVDERTFLLTDKSNGKTMATQRIALSPDGKTMTITLGPEAKPTVTVFERK
jgi:hypothetical protein